MRRSDSTAAIVAAIIQIRIIPTSVAVSMDLADCVLPGNQNGPNVTIKLRTASIAIRKALGLAMINPTCDVRHCSRTPFISSSHAPRPTVTAKLQTVDI